MTPFLYRVGMSKLFCSFIVGFNFAFYGAFYFREGSNKTIHDTLGCWIPSHFLYFWSATYSCPSKQDLILIFTDSVIVNIIHIFHTVLDIKSKRYKWNVVKLPPEAVICRCSSKWVFFKMPQYSQENICIGRSF